MVRYNRWCDLRLPSLSVFRPELSLSVVVPYFEQLEDLDLLLASLERQTYPRDLFEVVVVDDGSSPPLPDPLPTPLNLKVVHQEDRGFGLARARNAGARAAAHDILVFVDADMILAEGCLAAHARWHHAAADALTFGEWIPVDVAGLKGDRMRAHRGPVRAFLAGRRTERPWLRPHLARTRDLLSLHDDCFRAMAGSHFGVRRPFYELVGGSDESFTRYGGEDTEFAYRAQVRGALLVPVTDALSWHQGLFRRGREAKDVCRALQRSKVAHLVAHDLYRPPATGTGFQVPKYVVTVDGDGGNAVATVDGLLSCRERDLVVRFAAPRRGALRGQCGTHPRVRVDGGDSALEDFPASPFHLRVPAGADVPAGLVGGLRALLGSKAMAESILADGSPVSIARAWVLHRARRAGRPASDFGDTVRASPARLRRTARRDRHVAIQPIGKAASPGDLFRRLRYEMAMVRTPRQMLAFARWLAEGLGRKLAGRGGRG